MLPGAGKILYSGRPAHFRKEIQLIRYMGIRKTDDGGKLYVFVVNGLRKEVKEANLKQHPGCFDALPASVKDEIAKNRAWLSRVN